LAAGVVGAAGCQEHAGRTAQPFEPPQFSEVGGVVCNARDVLTLSGKYLTGDRRNVAKQLIPQLQKSTPGSVAAREVGFEFLVLVSQEANEGVTLGTPQNGSDLANAVLVCMFTDPAHLPAVFPEDFTTALDPAGAGAFEVRPDAAIAEPGVVPARDGFSFVRPPLGADWDDVLSGLVAPQRALLYGEPGGEPDTYDWNVVPRNAVFSPQVVVGLCLDDTPESMVRKLDANGVVLLSFVLVDCDAFDIIVQEASGASLLERLVHLGRDLFLPRPLEAASALIRLGPGGSAGGFSTFSVDELDEEGEVAQGFGSVPEEGILDEPLSPFTVTVTGNGASIVGVAVTVTAIAQTSGEPVKLEGTTTVVTDGAGVALFDDVAVTLPGAILLVANGTVIGRPGIVVPEAVSDKVSIRRQLN
jgi:hypothetical protein